MTVQLSGSAELAEGSPKTWDIWRCVDSDTFLREMRESQRAVLGNGDYVIPCRRCIMIVRALSR